MVNESCPVFITSLDLTCYMFYTSTNAPLLIMITGPIPAVAKGIDKNQITFKRAHKCNVVKTLNSGQFKPVNQPVALYSFQSNNSGGTCFVK